PRSKTSRASRTNRQVARSKTCLRGIEGLNDQSKSSSTLSSRNWAAFTRRLIATARPRFRPAPTGEAGAGHSAGDHSWLLLLVKEGTGNYAGTVRRNGTGLC